MKPPRQGSDYEQRASNYLQQQGYIILTANFYCKGGEIDLIARLNQQLVFIEVKQRKSTDYGHPAEFVSPHKQLRLQKCAQFFLLKHPQFQSCAMRFDLISFVGDQVEWIPNAFGAW